MAKPHAIRAARATDLPFVYAGELDYIQRIEPRQEARWKDAMIGHPQQWTASLPRMFGVRQEDAVAGFQPQKTSVTNEHRRAASRPRVTPRNDARIAAGTSLATSPPICRPFPTTSRVRSMLGAVVTCLLGMMSMAHAAPGLLHAQDRSIVDAAGHIVHLTGFNLGGWFVMEHFMSPMDRSGKLRDTYGVATTLQQRFGAEQARALMQGYARNWIDTSDIQRIAAAGYNVVRIPVWWGQFLALDNPAPSGWRADAFAVLDNIVRDCRAHGVYVILDMHGAVGSQSPASNTGQAGRNAYWTDPAARTHTDWLWARIAAHYRGDPTIAGYDLLNEPAPPGGMPAKTAVWNAYDRLYTAVRTADPDHMIFIEDTFGKWDWSMLPDPRTRGWTNVVYEMHVYRWPRPGESAASLAQAVVDSAQHAAADFRAHADWHVPGYVGEFNGFDTGPAVWQQVVNAYDNAGLSWSMWSYKAVNGVAPNHWGYQDPLRWPARPDPATDTAADILRNWENWKTEANFAVNPALGLRAPRDPVCAPVRCGSAEPRMRPVNPARQSEKLS